MFGVGCWALTFLAHYRPALLPSTGKMPIGPTAKMAVLHHGLALPVIQKIVYPFPVDGRNSSRTIFPFFTV